MSQQFPTSEKSTMDSKSSNTEVLSSPRPTQEPEPSARAKFKGKCHDWCGTHCSYWPLPAFAGQLSILDRLLTPLILLCMIVGVIIGEFVPNVQHAFDTVRFKSVSVREFTCEVLLQRSITHLILQQLR